MMEDLGAWLAGRGMVLPAARDLVEAGVALGLAAAALLSGWLAGRRLGPWLAGLWTRRVGGHVEGLAPRMCAIARHGAAALALVLVLALWPWANLAEFVLGLAQASVVALLVVAVLRGLALPRWASWSMALLAFVAVLSHAIGGLAPIEASLAQIGITIGMRRITLLSVVTVAVTLVLLFAAVRLANRILAQSVRRARAFDPTQRLLIEKLGGIALLLVAFFVGVDLLDIDLTAFAVFSGALGLAVGFGLQKTVGNLIAGIILLMDRSIKPGDVIVVGDSFGWVNKIGVRAVSVVTRDGKEHLIPNENLMTQEVENWSYSDRNVRVRIPVGVAYSCDLRLAQELMLRAASESPRVLDDPRPNVWLTGFGESSVDHEILAWINDPEIGVGNVKSDVLNRLWHLFQEHGIEIPYPQRDLHVKTWPEPGGA